MFTHTPVAPGTSAHPPAVFYFVGNKLLVRKSGETSELPVLQVDPGTRSTTTLAGIGTMEVARNLFLGMLGETPCRVIELTTPDLEEDSSYGEAQQGAFELTGLRSLIGKLDEELLHVAGVASQVLDWDRNHQFCGRCGTPTVASDTERSRTCPRCSLTAYPRISPAIIVAVVKGDRILLGKNRRHRGSGLFSVLAGFVEPGESLEECVRREVREEVRIELGKIDYFASQPWPFPHSLMIAFTAAYKSGEIEVDGTEIVEAGWYDRDHLPPIPPHGTVARRLIDWFTRG